MKKSLVLAMAMALGVTASAYAANPFSDVPAGHWAYDSIDKLAAAGVVDGMGDGSFQGDRHMTRYEMAQIVAKAMAKGANVDKLAAEFADELDALGVRVAALEKKADNVKITGTIGFHAKWRHAQGNGNSTSANDMFKLRSDLTIKGQVNEDWTYTALIRNEQEMGDGYTKDAKTTNYKGVGEEETRFQRAWVDGRVAGLKVKAGRYNKVMGHTNHIWNDRVDGVEVAYGKDVKLNLGYAQLANDRKDVKYGVEAKVAYAELTGKVSKRLGLEADYYMFSDVNEDDGYVADNKFAILALGADYALAKNLNLSGTYFHSDADMEAAVKNGANDKDGFNLKLSYKGASAAKPGSFGIYGEYVDLSAAVVVGDGAYSTPAFLPNKATAGYKGMIYGANYALAKNIVGTVEYYDLKAKSNSDKTQTLYTGVAFTF